MISSEKSVPFVPPTPNTQEGRVHECCKLVCVCRGEGGTPTSFILRVEGQVPMEPQGKLASCFLEGGKMVKWILTLAIATLRSPEQTLF